MTRPLRRVDLDLGVLRHLDADAGAEHHQTRLLAAGFLTEPVDARDPEHPSRTLHAIREQLFGLLAAEDSRRAIEVHKPFRTGAVKGGVLFAIPATALLVGRFFLHRETSSQLAYGLLALLVGIFRGFVFWGLLAGLGLGYVVWFDRKKRGLLTAWDIERARALEGLEGDVRALAGRSFVARLGPTLLRNTPHRAWASAAREAVLGELRRRGGSRGAEGPDDAWGAQARALLDDLSTAVAATKEALDEATADPPAGWTDRGLTVDVAGLSDRLDALQIRRTRALDEATGALGLSGRGGPGAG